jgi:hypothetical protein
MDGSSSSFHAVPSPPPGIDRFSAGQPGVAPPPAAASSKGKQPPTNPAQTEDEKQRQPALFHKTKMCKFNQLGLCTRGEFCRFAHGKMDMNALPDLSRTKLCKELINTGQCTQRNCKFAHNKHELRRHPFLHQAPFLQNGEKEDSHQAAGSADAQSYAQAQLAAGVAPEALGQQVAQLQANASLLCSDLANILHRMQEKESVQARMQSQANTTAMHSELANALKGFGGKELLGAWTQQQQAADVAPASNFGDLLGGGAGFQDDMVGAGYLESAGHIGYPGAGIDSAEMEQLAAAAIWGQESFYESLLEDRPMPLPYGLSGGVLPADRLQRKLLSPMYAPSVSAMQPPPMALA